MVGDHDVDAAEVVPSGVGEKRWILRFAQNDGGNVILAEGQNPEARSAW